MQLASGQSSWNYKAIYSCCGAAAERIVSCYILDSFLMH